MSANKALCLNNLMIHVKNSQGNTLQTNTGVLYCWSDDGRWRFQLKQSKSIDCESEVKIALINDNSVLERFNDGTDHLSLTSTSLSHGSPLLQHKISHKLHPPPPPPPPCELYSFEHIAHTYAPTL